GTNLLTGTLGTINGQTLTAGGTITVASTTLLANNNTFSGNTTFTASTTFTKVVNIANASSSLTTLGTTWFSGLTNAILSTNANGQVVATTSVGAGYISGTLGVGNGGTGSTTLSGILLGNGTSPVQTLGIGTGLQLSGGTLSTNNIPNASLQNSTISGVSLGGTLFNLSVNSTLSGSPYNGGAAQTFGLNLGNANNWTALQTFSNATSTLFSAGTIWDTGLSNALLSVDQNGKIIATTSIGTNLLSGNLATINGTTIAENGTYTIPAASSTLLANNNTFSGNNTFTALLNLSNGFVAAASSTVTNNFTVTGTANVGALSIGSLNGILKTVSGAVVTATAGTDYQAPITASYPILFSGNNLSLGFGTTTTNTWSQLQTLTSGFIANSSSTVVGNFTVQGSQTSLNQASTTLFTNSGATYLTSITNGLLSTNANGQVVATTSVGVNYLSGVLPIANGGTGTSSAPLYGNLLVGNGSNGYNYVATSSLGLPTFTNLSSSIAAAYDFPQAGNGTSTLTQFNGGLTAFASSTIGNGNQTGGLTINGGATTTGNSYVSGEAFSGSGFRVASIVGDDVNNAPWYGIGAASNSTVQLAGYFGLSFVTNFGNVLLSQSGNFGIGTTTPGSILSVNGVGNFVNGATSTLYNGLQVPSLSNSGATYLTSITNSLLSTNAGGQVVATTSIGTNYLTGTLATINTTPITAGGTFTITAASSTLLGDNNTFTGANTFTKALTLSGTTGTTTIAAGQGFTIGSQFIAQQGSGDAFFPTVGGHVYLGASGIGGGN
ncbi:MAG: hypothetical protein P4L81_07545, partial [Candidatus Pacebacteria bacterium]|nr:hypothetical protein [Candidatus Paceibacterota bacterium]